jgi:O-antigen/teichoic acid export membrane protein
VMEVLVGIPALAVGTVFPVISRAARDDAARLAYASARIVELALIGGTGLALMVVLIAPFAIEVLAGAAGAPAAGVLQIQGLALIATFLAVATGYVLLSVRRHSALLIANSAALAANIALTLALVPVAHARGAAIAAVIAESCLALGQVLLLLRAGHFRLRARSVAAVAAAGGLGALVLLIPGLSTGPGCVLRTLAGAVVYASALAAFGVLPPELRQVLPARRVT